MAAECPQAMALRQPPRPVAHRFGRGLAGSLLCGRPSEGARNPPTNDNVVINSLSSTAGWGLILLRPEAIRPPERSRLRLRIYLHFSLWALEGRPRGRPFFCALVRSRRGRPRRALLALGGDLHAYYASRLLRVAFLAPDLKRAILEGRQPAAMNLQAIMTRDLPWPGTLRARSSAAEIGFPVIP